MANTDRYEIRQLTLADVKPVTAIITHANIYHSGFWTPKYGNDKKALKDMFQMGQYLVQHQIESGYSFGVIDKQYEYKTPEAKDAGGLLLWDGVEEVSDESLLQKMDFPLVSIALAFDATKMFDMSKLGPMFGRFSEFPMIFGWSMMNDKRPDEIKNPHGERDVLSRAGTATRSDYENRGLARMLAEYEMHHVAKLGFRSIVIGTTSERLAKVWLSPPAPYKAEVICQAKFADIELPTPTGEMIKPFPFTTETAHSIAVYLK